MVNQIIGCDDMYEDEDQTNQEALAVGGDSGQGDHKRKLARRAANRRSAQLSQLFLYNVFLIHEYKRL
jgi:hypothetical protein